MGNGSTEDKVTRDYAILEYELMADLARKNNVAVVVSTNSNSSRYLLYTPLQEKRICLGSYDTFSEVFVAVHLIARFRQLSATYDVPFLLDKIK